MVARLIDFCRQPDVRGQPVRALWRRLLWRAHWALRPNRPLVLRQWWEGMSIALPRSGCAAQVFYRRHSNSEIVRVMVEVLKPGDVMVDIGAHIGEYSLIAAKLVGPKGQVHALEPQPQAAEFVALNARLNDLANVTIHPFAVADVEGELPFRFDPRSWGGFPSRNGHAGDFTVHCTTLDAFVQRHGIERVQLVKVDAGGNERAVLRGGEALFTSLPAPVVICKLYNPRVVRERFGYEVREIVELLHSWGYQVRALTEDGVVPVDSAGCYRLLSGGTYGVPLMAKPTSRG